VDPGAGDAETNRNGCLIFHNALLPIEAACSASQSGTVKRFAYFEGKNMRYFHLLPALLLLSCKVSAQYVDLSWQPSFYCQPAEVIPYGGEWLVTAETYNNQGHNSGGYAARINTTGIQQIFHTPWEDPIYMLDATVSKNGDLAWVGGQGGCDLIYSGGAAIQNSAGEPIRVLDNNAEPNYLSLIESLPDGRFAAVGSQGTLLLDSMFNVLFRGGGSLVYTREIKSNGDSIAWVHLKRFNPASTRLYPRYYNATNFSFPVSPGFIGYSEPTVANIKDFYPFGLKIGALIDSSIWVSEYPFTTSTTVDLIKSGIDYQHIHYHEGHYYLFGMDASNRTWMQKRSEDLNTWENFLLPWDGYLWDVAIQDDTIALLGHRIIPDGNRYAGRDFPISMQNGGAANMLSFKTLSLKSFLSSSKDANIAIQNINWNGNYSVLSEDRINCPSDEGSYGQVWLNGFTIEVVNLGNRPVSGISVSTRRPSCGEFTDICESIYGFWFPFEEVTIPAGGSATFSIDEEMRFLLQDLEPPYELCFWATAHGAPTEHTYQDNLLCTNLDIHNGAPPEPDWRISPNPADRWIDITLPSGLETGSELLLYHSNGQILRRSILSPGTLKHRFGLEQLPAGLYAIVWLQGDTPNVKRFIKAP
jgi:hypothetical protein